MYAQPGSSATYPMLDMVSQRIYDRGRPSKGEALMKVRPMRPIAPATGKKRGGAKAKKRTNKQLAYEIALALNNEMTGGSINWDQVKNVATPYLKQGVSMGLNGRVSLILNPSPRSGLEFRVSELGLYFQLKKSVSLKSRFLNLEFGFSVSVAPSHLSFRRFLWKELELRKSLIKKGVHQKKGGGCTFSPFSFWHF